MATPALERAAKSKDTKKLLVELLVAWRELKHPRIADLIDRVSTKALEGIKPITGKSVPARAAAIVEAVTSEDPVELGRVLISQWPKTWQDALPVLEAVCQAPDDPRVAARLAALVDEAAHQSRGTRNFWGVAFGRLSVLGDVRQLPVLEAQLGRAKSSYYREHSERREVAIVERYRKLKTAKLSADDEKLLAELETPFGARVGAEKTKTRSGKELLEAVWANPTDLGVRTVYGDWLVEQGDPRGELIALQLGAPSEKSTKKIHSLIEKHWKKWLGPIADWFKVAPRFEAGFPVWGVVGQPSYRDGRSKLEPLLASPEWSTFRHLALPWDVIAPAELVVLPRFKALTSLGNLEPRFMRALKEVADKPALTSIEFSYGNENEVLPALTWDSFPHLERVITTPLTIHAVLSGVGNRTLPTLELRMDGGWIDQPFDFWWSQLKICPVGRVVMRCYETELEVTRSAPYQPFTHATYRSSLRIERLLKVLPPELTHLQTAPGVAPVSAPASALAHIDTLLAKYPKLEVRELPLRKEVPHVDFAIRGLDVLTEERVAKLWAILTTKFGVTFPEFSVGYSSGPKSLTENPVALLQQAARNKRVTHVYLTVPHSGTRCHLSKQALSATLPVNDVVGFVEAISECLALAPGVFTFEVDDAGVRFPTNEWSGKKASVITEVHGQVQKRQ